MTPWDDDSPIPEYVDDKNNDTNNDLIATSSNVYNHILQDMIYEGSIGAIKYDTKSYCADSLNDGTVEDDNEDTEYVDGDDTSVISNLDNGMDFNGEYANDKRKQKGNGLLKCAELEDIISEKLLCKQCCEESVCQKKGFGKLLSKNAKLKAVMHNYAFACTLLVTCASGKHTFKVEPNREVTNISNGHGTNKEQQPKCHGRPKSQMKYRITVSTTMCT